jgi:predicted metal-dependent hydrolase
VTFVSRSIEFGPETIHYEVRFVATRRTLGIEVHPDQTVRVRAPIGCTDGVIEQRMKARASWVSKQLARFRQFNPRTPPRRYISGETHLYLGRHYRLKVVVGCDEKVKLTRGQLQVSVPVIKDRERIKEILRLWYLENGRRIFTDVLQKCLLKFSVLKNEKPRLIVRSMRSRWGTFSSAGTMTLNVDLVRAPTACIEYVVTHELCHRQHRNHDAGFFRLLEELMPDWEKRKRRLETALI